MMEIPVKPGFPEFCKLFDQITLGRYGQPVFSAGGKEGCPAGVGAMDQAVCGTGTGARAVGLPEKPQVFPEIGGGADCEVPGRAVKKMKNEELKMKNDLQWGMKNGELKVDN